MCLEHFATLHPEHPILKLHPEIKPIVDILRYDLKERNPTENHLEIENLYNNFTGFLSQNPEKFRLLSKQLDATIAKLHADVNLNDANRDYLLLINMRSLAFAAGIFIDLPLNQIANIEKLSNLLEPIFNYRNPAQREMLLRQLAYAAAAEGGIPPLPTDQAKTLLRPWGQMSWILLCRLQERGLSADTARIIYHNISQRNGFKDGKATTTLLNFLHTIDSLEPLEQNEIELLTGCLNQTLNSTDKIKPYSQG